MEGKVYRSEPTWITKLLSAPRYSNEFIFKREITNIYFHHCLGQAFSSLPALNYFDGVSFDQNCDVIKIQSHPKIRVSNIWGFTTILLRIWGRFHSLTNLKLSLPGIFRFKRPIQFMLSGRKNGMDATDSPNKYLEEKMLGYRRHLILGFYARILITLNQFERKYLKSLMRTVQRCPAFCTKFKKFISFLLWNNFRRGILLTERDNKPKAFWMSMKKNLSGRSAKKQWLIVKLTRSRFSGQKTNQLIGIAFDRFTADGSEVWDLEVISNCVIESAKVQWVDSGQKKQTKIKSQLDFMNGGAYSFGKRGSRWRFRIISENVSIISL